MVAAGLAIESGQVTAVRAESEFVPERQSGWLADLESVRLAIEDDRTLVLDARSARDLRAKKQSRGRGCVPATFRAR